MNCIKLVASTCAVLSGPNNLHRAVANLTSATICKRIIHERLANPMHCDFKLFSISTGG